MFVFSLEGLNHYVLQESKYASLCVDLLVADMGNNTLKPFLVVTRIIKSFCMELGPYDDVRLTVDGEGNYKLTCHDKTLEANVVIPPYSASGILAPLDQLADVSMVVVQALADIRLLGRL